MITVDEAFAPLEINRAAAQSMEDAWRPISPVPADAPKLTKKTLQRFAPHGYAFTAGWRYRDADSRLLGFAVRFDRPANGHPADKQVKPVTFCLGPDGRHEWRCKRSGTAPKTRQGPLDRKFPGSSVSDRLV
jgi:hypothetical protein